MEQLKDKAPVLHLNLKKVWFDIIGDTKPEEYRAMNPYWHRIFANGNIKIKGRYYNPSDVVICFSNGYAKNRPQKFFRIKRLRNGFGKEQWGAKYYTHYFILELGDRL